MNSFRRRPLYVVLVVVLPLLLSLTHSSCWWGGATYALSFPTPSKRSPPRQLSEEGINQRLPKPSKIVIPLLQAAALPQSRSNRRQVEQLIHSLSNRAKTTPKTYRKPIRPGVYRTVWSTVTSDSIPGLLFRNKPSNVLGGPSWQCISTCMTQGTNIVYWDWCDVRMAGLARLNPVFDDDGGRTVAGYDLTICGLEFRWGANGCPEARERNLQSRHQEEVGRRWKVFELDEDTVLGNGVGKLELLYNDGVVRVTTDVVQGNTYVHIREPLSSDLEEMFAV